MTDGVESTEISELPAEFGADVTLLDVREDDEWGRGHAPGAQHLPMGEVPGRMAEIDPGKELYVICRSGGRSQRVAAYMLRNGYDAINVAGGMLAWTAAGRPVVTDDGSLGEI